MKDVAARAQAVTAELKEANKQLEIAKAKLASSQIDGLFQNAVEVDGVRIVTVYLNGTTPDTLRSMMDKLRDKEPNAVGALIGTDGSKTTLAVGVGKNALARGLKAGALVKHRCHCRRQRRRQAGLRHGRYPRYFQDRRCTERCGRHCERKPGKSKLSVL